MNVDETCRKAIAFISEHKFTVHKSKPTFIDKSLSLVSDENRFSIICYVDVEKRVVLHVTYTKNPHATSNSRYPELLHSHKVVIDVCGNSHSARGLELEYRDWFKKYNLMNGHRGLVTEALVTDNPSLGLDFSETKANSRDDSPAKTRAGEAEIAESEKEARVRIAFNRISYAIRKVMASIDKDFATIGWKPPIR